jgi:hypothetical protein
MLDDILQAITSALRSGSETEVPANNASTGIRG